MASEAPSAKRPRCDDFAEPNEFTKSRFWFDDGNVILQAENTEFKVHRSLLANQSVVFRDMFSIPQPADPDPVVDGCPVVPLSDKAADIEHVLSLFYDNFKAHDMREHMPFPLLAAILRIGKKYQIDHLQNEGLHRLRKEFPTDFANWNESWADVVAIESVSENLEGIINLAHELSVQSILPALYLTYLSGVKMDDILNGIKDSDGVSTRLNKEAARQCLKGRNRLIQELFNLTKNWFSTPGVIPSPSCERIMICSSEKSRAIFDLPAMKLEEMEILYPLTTTGHVSALCHQCIETLRQSFDEAREAMWRELPTYFGLPEWEQLRDFA